MLQSISLVAHHPEVGGKERLIGSGLVDLFRNSSLGQFQSLLSAVQFSSKTPTPISNGRPVHVAVATYKSAKHFDSEETRLCQAAWVWEAASSHQNIMRRSLRSHSKDQQRDTRRARASSHDLWNHTYILSKHHPSSHMSASADHSFTCICFSKTSYDITEFLKKPGIPTSVNELNRSQKNHK